MIRSNWGTHEVAQEELIYKTAKGISKRYSNNLALLESGEFYKGKCNEWKGYSYRAYRDWLTFARDYSDYFVFSGEFNQLLTEHQPIKQLEIFSLTKPDPECYYNLMLESITKGQEYLDGKAI